MDGGGAGRVTQARRCPCRLRPVPPAPCWASGNRSCWQETTATHHKAKISCQPPASLAEQHGGSGRAGRSGCRLEPSPHQGPIPVAKHPPHLQPGGPTARTAEEEGAPLPVQLPDTSCAHSRTPNRCPRLPILRPCVQAWPGPVTPSVRLASPPLASSPVCPAPATPPPPR